MDDIKITGLQRLSIKLNDILVYKSHKELNCDQHYHIAGNLIKILLASGMNNKVIVLNPDDELTFIGIDEMIENNIQNKKHNPNGIHFQPFPGVE